MVFHVSSIHFPDTTSRVYFVSSVNHSVVERHHDGGCFEYRPWFKQIADSKILDFPILTVGTFGHVHHGLYVSCRYIHDNHHSRIAIHLWVFKFLNESPFCQVLYTHVDCGDDVAAINRRCDWNVHPVV